MREQFVGMGQRKTPSKPMFQRKGLSTEPCGHTLSRALEHDLLPIVRIACLSDRKLFNML